MSATRAKGPETPADPSGMRRKMPKPCLWALTAAYVPLNPFTASLRSCKSPFWCSMPPLNPSM